MMTRVCLYLVLQACFPITIVSARITPNGKGFFSKPYCSNFGLFDSVTG